MRFTRIFAIPICLALRVLGCASCFIAPDKQALAFHRFEQAVGFVCIAGNPMPINVTCSPMSFSTCNRRIACAKNCDIPRRLKAYSAISSIVMLHWNYRNDEQCGQILQADPRALRCDSGHFLFLAGRLHRRARFSKCQRDEFSRPH